MFRQDPREIHPLVDGFNKILGQKYLAFRMGSQTIGLDSSGR